MRRFLWPLIISISALLAGFTASSNSQSTVRLLLTFWFLLVCPGMAVVRLFHFREKLAEWVLAVGLSIAIDVIVSEIAVINHWWSLQKMVDALIFICFAGALLQVWNTFHNRKQDIHEYDRN